MSFSREGTENPKCAKTNHGKICLQYPVYDRKFAGGCCRTYCGAGDDGWANGDDGGGSPGNADVGHKLGLMEGLWTNEGGVNMRMKEESMDQ